MTTLLFGVLIVLLIVLLWRYLAQQPHGKNKDRTELADALSYLLQLMENGGLLSADVVDSHMCLIFERVKGDDREACVVMRVNGSCEPNWASALGEIHRDLLATPTSWLRSTGEELHWHVADIWNEASVAPMVSVAWEVLDRLGIPESARIDFRLDGPRSGRALRRLKNGTSR